MWIYIYNTKCKIVYINGEKPNPIYTWLPALFYAYNVGMHTYIYAFITNFKWTTTTNTRKYSKPSI